MTLRQRWLQFSVGTLIFLMLCVAGFLGGYRSGYNAGNDARDLQLSATVVYSVLYQVADLVLPLPDGATTASRLQEIGNLIQTTVQPQSWQNERCQMTPYGTNVSLVITQTEDGHREIARFLEELRRLRTRFSERIAHGQCGYCGFHELPQPGTACGQCEQVYSPVQAQHAIHYEHVSD